MKEVCFRLQSNPVCVLVCLDKELNCAILVFHAFPTVNQSPNHTNDYINGPVLKTQQRICSWPWDIHVALLGVGMDTKQTYLTRTTN